MDGGEGGSFKEMNRPLRRMYVPLPASTPILGRMRGDFSYLHPSLIRLSMPSVVILTLQFKLLRH